MEPHSDFRNGYNQNLDTVLDIKIRIVLVLVSLVILFVNGISFIALKRTRHTPRTAKFLSSSLLVFDFVATLMYTIRRLITDTQLNFLFQILAMSFNYLGFIDIAIMSIERLILFHWPNFYIRKITLSAFRRICFASWVLYILFWLSDCIMCYVAVDDNDPKTIYCFTDVIHRHIRIVYWSTTMVSCVCLMKIIVIITNQSSKMTGNKTVWHTNKSTMVVLICIVNYIITTVCGFFITYFVEEAYLRRLFNDLLMICNGLVDTSVYVLWFKECRLEILKILGKMFPSLNKYAEAMRIIVFDITTYNNQVLR